MLRQRRTVVAAVVTALLAAGCSDSDTPGATSTPSPSPRPSATSSTSTAAPLMALPARTIRKRAEAAIKAAETLRLKGTVVSESQSVSIHMLYGKTATAGSVTIGGASIALIVIGKTIYVKPSEAFWRRQLPSEQKAEALIELVRGKWIKAPLTDRQFGSFGQFADKDSFIAKLFQDVPPKLKKTGPKLIDGVQCIGIDDGDGILWVDSSNARPVRINAPSGSKDRGALTFTEYNAVTEPKAPPAELVIDSKKLGS
jgi:hypothetical protein